ncbi:MAG: hypothetical protein RLZZ230_139 [Candidatus Parcubacteria bacterium]|jgi:hypothetical protein
MNILDVVANLGILGFSYLKEWVLNSEGDSGSTQIKNGGIGCTNNISYTYIENINISSTRDENTLIEGLGNTLK